MPDNKSKFISKTANLLTARLLPISFLLVAIVSALAFIFLLLPKYKAVTNSISTAEADIQEAIDQKSNFLNRLKKHSEELTNIDKYNLGKLEKMLTGSVDMSEIITVLNKLSERSGFVLEDVKYFFDENELKTQNIASEIKKVDFLITVSGGGYDELKYLLQMIANNVNIIDVTGIMFDGSSSYNLELEVYYIERAKDNNIASDSNNLTLTSEFFDRKSFLNLNSQASLGSVAPIDTILQDENTPPPIENLVVVDPGIGDRLNLFWENMPSAITAKIKIYRFAIENGKGELVAELNKDAAAFTDKGLVTDNEYYYLARSVSDKNVESRNTKKFSGTPTNVMPPEIPLDVKISEQAGKIEIAWTNPSSPDLAYVYIYKSKDKSSLGELSAKIQAYAGKKQVWEDEAVESYKQYYYALVAEDTAGNRSSDQITKFGSSDLFEVKKGG
ncbi:MAG: hypothetical protein V1770_00790 [bacterium]